MPADHRQHQGRTEITGTFLLIVNSKASIDHIQNTLFHATYADMNLKPEHTDSTLRELLSGNGVKAKPAQDLPEESSTA